MESTKKSSALLIAFLLVIVVGLTALDMYQDKVIERQRYEMHWLLTHSVIKVDAPAPAKGAQQTPGPAPATLKSEQKAGSTPVPVATEAATAVAPASSTAKP